jgi:hypothetical protein
MPRIEGNPGEMAQVSVGLRHQWTGSFGVRENPQRAESCQAGYVPPEQPKPPKRPYCKTCDDRVCVGNCKY